MLFNSTLFLIFLTVVVALFHQLQPKGRRGLLLLASYTFYWVWSIPFSLLLVGSTLVDYLAQKKRFQVIRPLHGVPGRQRPVVRLQSFDRQQVVRFRHDGQRVGFRPRWRIRNVDDNVGPPGWTTRSFPSPATPGIRRRHPPSPLISSSKHRALYCTSSSGKMIRPGHPRSYRRRRIANRRPGKVGGTIDCVSPATSGSGSSDRPRSVVLETISFRSGSVASSSNSSQLSRRHQRPSERLDGRNLVNHLTVRHAAHPVMKPVAGGIDVPGPVAGHPRLDDCDAV